MAVDLGTGEPIAVGYINEYDPQAVRRGLEPLVQRHGITVIVTDDLSSYKIVAEKLQLGHQVCQFQVRRWVGKALKELQETIPKQWLWVLEEIRQLIEFCHPMGAKAYMPSGNNYPVVVPNAINRVRLWNSCAICSCA